MYQRLLTIDADVDIAQVEIWRNDSLPAKKDRNKMLEQIKRARAIKKSLGTVVAAKYLKKRGWSFEGAHYILLDCYPRK